MQLRKISTHNRGFSLIELVVVLGILTALASCTLVISMESYRGASFADEQELLVVALQKARSQAQSGVCIVSTCTNGLSHGVYITPTQVIIFEGSSYNPNDDANEYLPLSNTSITIGGLHDSVFAEFSGNASPAGTITLSDTAGHSSTITVGSSGQILW